jgi:hypothetical protein
MTKISSRATFWYKKAFPALWFGFLAFFVFGGLMHGGIEENAIFLFVAVLMTVMGWVVMKQLVWDLADEVYDGGDFLLVRKGDEEERIPLSNVMNVSASTALNPPRVTLRLVNPGKLGTEVAFSPAARATLNPFAKNPVTEDLIVRVDRARSRR